MKSTLLSLVAFFCFFFQSNAQITKGSVFLGGDIGGSTNTLKSETGKYKTRSFSISPVFGKAIKNNLVVGGSLVVGLTDQDTQPYVGVVTNSRIFGAGIFVRRYWQIAKSDFYVFLQGGLNATSQQSKYSSNSGTNREKHKIFAVGVSASPGISYQVSKRLHLETGFSNVANLYYSHEKHTNETNPAYNYTTDGVGLSASLNSAAAPFYMGFRVLIGK